MAARSNEITLRSAVRRVIECVHARCVPMENLIVYVIVQLNLVFGVAGLVWPDKLMPVFGVLMFPWPASYRAIRTHGIVAIVGYVLVVCKLLLASL